MTPIGAEGTDVIVVVRIVRELADQLEIHLFVGLIFERDARILPIRIVDGMMGSIVPAIAGSVQKVEGDAAAQGSARIQGAAERSLRSMKIVVADGFIEITAELGCGRVG